MKKLLLLKHWQLFCLLVGLPIVLEIVSIGLIFATGRPEIFFLIVPVMVIVFMALFFGWFWTLGTNLHKKLPATVSMNLTRFKFFLLFPVVYLPLFVVFIIGYLGGRRGEEPLSLAFLPFIFLLHIFCMFCMFYCMYFISKELKSAELRREASFSDCAGEFFMLWFYPVGIWILQPRINILFRQPDDFGLFDEPGPNDALPAGGR